MAIRVVVAGLGPRGLDWLREIQTATGYELVACVETDQSILNRVPVNPNKRFTQLAEALEQNSCDAVIVATSPGNHVEPCDRSARKCNLVLSRSGSFWEHESFDHVIRRGKFNATLKYVLNNPVKVGPAKCWRDWPWNYCRKELSDNF